VTYVNEVPRHINGYDALFLSFGNSSTFYSLFEDGFVNLLKEYLQKGGKVYLEGGSALGSDQNNPVTRQLFGLENAVSPAMPFTLFDTVAGIPGSVCDGMVFTGTEQIGQFFTDYYNPGNGGVAALEQEDFGAVAVQKTGAHGEKTFCFSYILAELQDGETTREELMWAILNYFDIVTKIRESELPASLLNLSVYPNPTGGSLQFAVRSSQGGRVTLKLYNVQGQKVAVVLDELIPAGERSVEFDMSGLPVGVYFYRLTFSGQQSAVSGKILKF
jgi:hypothetical protein